MRNQNSAEFLDLVYPKQLELIDRNELKDYLDFEYSESVFQMVSYKVDSSTNIVLIDHKKYVQFFLLFEMAMLIGDFPTDLESILLPLKNQFGQENVDFNDGLKRIEIKKPKQLLLILDPEIGQWKLLFDYNVGGKKLIEPFINDELKSTFKL